MPWDDGLEGTHKNIAAYPGSPLRVVAGPGTGKTFSLMRRIARLLESGVNPSSILAVTFTRTAAKDLIDKLNELGSPGAANVIARTLHALCFATLRRNGVLEITGRTPRPILAQDQKMLEWDVQGQFGGKKNTRKLVKAFEAYWATLQYKLPGWPTDPIEQAFDGALKSWLRFHQAMLIGEVVPLALDFIAENPGSPDAPSFAHVVADEYQDLNKADQAVIDAFGRNGSIVAVGDEDQSIYSFRFAHPEGITDFATYHAGTHDELLMECRRCPRTVVTLACALISHNIRSNIQTITPRVGNVEGDVHIVQHSTAVDESQSIAGFVDFYLANNADVTAGDVLILTARRRFGYAIRNELNSLASTRNRAWTARSFFYEEALDDVLAQEGLALLTLLVRRSDRVALRTWLGLRHASGTAAAYARLRSHCEATGEAPSVALDRMVVGDLQLPYSAGIVSRYQLLVEALSEIATLDIQALVDRLFPADEVACEEIRAMACGLVGDSTSADALLEGLMAALTQPELPGSQDGVIRIMSLHKSKGLTARLVVVAGCVEGAIPMIDEDLSPVAQQAMLEEQRRLFYVALTRTTQCLVLSSPARMSYSDAKRMGVTVQRQERDVAVVRPTRFIAELGPTRPRTKTAEQWRVSVGF